MPQVTLASLGLKADILVELPEYVNGETRWVPIAQVQDLVYSPSQRKVYVSVKIFAYSRQEDGSLIHLPQIPGEDDFMIADDSTIVDMDGNYLVKNAPVGLTEAEMEALYPQLVGIPWGREGEMFCIKAQTQALTVHPLIEAKVRSKYWPQEPQT